LSAAGNEEAAYFSTRVVLSPAIGLQLLNKKRGAMMNMTKILVLLLGMTLLLPAAALSQNLKTTPKAATRAMAPIKVSVHSSWQVNSVQIGVNCGVAVEWQSIPNTYRYVWLQVCKADKTACGGAFTIKNNWLYMDFRPDTSMAGQEWVIKVYTQDKKYTGYSNKFFVDGMLPPCCADGLHVPPHCDE
jgi:hypothetical protein